MSRPLRPMHNDSPWKRLRFSYNATVKNNSFPCEFPRLARALHLVNDSRGFSTQQSVKDVHVVHRGNRELRGIFIYDRYAHLKRITIHTTCGISFLWNFHL